MRVYALLSVLLSVVFMACQDCPDCPTPPSELRFQVKDILGRDATTGRWAKYPYKSVRLNYMDGQAEKEIALTLDTFYDDRTIFIAPEVPKLTEKGLNKFLLYLKEEADTIEVDLIHVQTVCCEYPLYEYLKFNSKKMESSTEDDYVFVLVK